MLVRASGRRGSRPSEPWAAQPGHRSGTLVRGGERGGYRGRGQTSEEDCGLTGWWGGLVPQPPAVVMPVPGGETPEGLSERWQRVVGTASTGRAPSTDASFEQPLWGHSPQGSLSPSSFRMWCTKHHSIPCSETPFTEGERQPLSCACARQGGSRQGSLMQGLSRPLQLLAHRAFTRRGRARSACCSVA